MPPKNLAFTVQEYRGRVAKVQKAINAFGWDGLLLHNLASICYLTGFQSLSVHKFWTCIVLPEGDPILLSQDFESYNAQWGCWLTHIETFEVFADPVAALRDLLKKMKLDRKKLGIELGTWSSLTAQGYLKLQQTVPKATFEDATDIVPRVQAVKSPTEIKYLREAGRISTLAMQAAIDAVAEGRTDNDIAAAASAKLIQEGSEYQCYQPIVTVGLRSGIPHTSFHRIPIRAGDPVFMEFGACINRYSAPMMRTAVIGEPSPKMRRMFEMCRRSVDASIAALGPGVTGGEVAAAAGKAIGKLPAGWVWHGYHAYSVGLGFPPEWADSLEVGASPGSKAILEPGMSFHCSTSIRDPGKLGTTCSETVLITENGCDVLTDLPRQLFVK